MSNPRKNAEQITQPAERKTKSAATVAVYFTDDAGLRYRVYDTTYTKDKHRQHPIGDPSAAMRMFVPPSQEEMLRAYRFKKDESRALDPQTLARQLRDAEYAPRVKPDNSHLKPW
ncbi:MAG: hypothetical protein ACJ796_05445 [Gemmatimonadaceae bacterium]